MIPLVGFLPAHDPRVRGTIEAIERELVEGGFVLRYRTVDTGDVDGLTGREGAFLACSFWLADCLSLLGRDHDARQLLDRLLGLRNDLGLLSEEYDPVAGRLVGNFPQAFSHVSLVNSASKIGGEEKPTSGHVVAGLARRSMIQGKGGVGTRHMGVFSARRVLSRLVDGGSPDVARGAAHVVKEAIGSPPGVTGARGKPTVRRSVKRSTTRAGKKPGKAGLSAAGEAGMRTATKKVANRQGTVEEGDEQRCDVQEGDDEEGADCQEEVGRDKVVQGGHRAKAATGALAKSTRRKKAASTPRPAKRS